MIGILKVDRPAFQGIERGPEGLHALAEGPRVLALAGAQDCRLDPPAPLDTRSDVRR
jgi:hypothetical protein